MFTKITKRHVLVTALTLVCCYGALLSTGPSSETEPAAPEPAASPAAPAPVQPSAAPSNSVLSALSARLSDLEPQPPAPTKPELEARAVREPVQEAGPEPAFAAWMLAAIRGEEWDRDHTREVEAELSATLERAPDLHAQELECGKRFCRALLVDRRGGEVELQALLGAPPFDGEGFSTLGQAGQAEIYFTRSGQSLDALRMEAQL